MSVDSVKRKFDRAQRELAMAQGQVELLRKQLEDTREQMDRSKARLELLEDVQLLLLAASASAREQIKGSIESLVTFALRAIKGEDYSFKIETKQSAGQYTVDFLIVSPDARVLDVLNTCGGGISDIVSVAMRIAILQMYDPTGGPILLDENFKFLSRDNIRAVVDFLRTVISKTGRQIILVTHIPEFSIYADNVIEVVAGSDSSTVITYDKKELDLP